MKFRFQCQQMKCMPHSRARSFSGHHRGRAGEMQGDSLAHRAAQRTLWSFTEGPVGLAPGDSWHSPTRFPGGTGRGRVPPAQRAQPLSTLSSSGHRGRLPPHSLPDACAGAPRSPGPSVTRKQNKWTRLGNEGGAHQPTGKSHRSRRGFTQAHEPLVMK